MKKLVIPQQFIYSGKLVLVNAQYPYCCENAEAGLSPAYAGSKILLEHRASVLLARLMSSMNGWTQIDAVSGWRTQQEQQQIYDHSLGHNGPAFTKQFVAMPGHSEHQTGLAIDLGLRQPDMDFICPEFPYSGICQAFREKAPAYGFMERYPKGKEVITGIAHEPWHFRYVGAPHAAIMTQLGLTLEEYHAFLRQYPHGEKHFSYKTGHQSIQVSYAKATPGTDTVLEIPADIPYSLSGNNIDGFILTQWASVW